jgi:hypothetical protein
MAAAGPLPAVRRRSKADFRSGSRSRSLATCSPAGGCGPPQPPKAIHRASAGQRWRPRRGAAFGAIPESRSRRRVIDPFDLCPLPFNVARSGVVVAAVSAVPPDHSLPSDGRYPCSHRNSHRQKQRPPETGLRAWQDGGRAGGRASRQPSPQAPPSRRDQDGAPSYSSPRSASPQNPRLARRVVLRPHDRRTGLDGMTASQLVTRQARGDRVRWVIGMPGPLAPCTNAR